MRIATWLWPRILMRKCVSELKATNVAQLMGTYAYDGAVDRVSKTAGAATANYTLDLSSALPPKCSVRPRGPIV